MGWIIKGSGGTIGGTGLTPAALNMTGATLEFQSLAADTFSWTAAADDATGAGTIIPTLGQVIELFWDNGATLARKFRGHVTAVQPTFSGVSVQVDGPWWWLQRIMLTSSVFADGGYADRVKFGFATGPLTTMFNNLINRMITNGVPMTNGGVATMYDFVKLTISNTNGAEALGKLMQRCPDAVAYFDYSGSSGTNPALVINRRSGMATNAYAVGTDNLEMGGIRPRLDLEVSQVSLQYLARNPVNGQLQFKALADGTATVGKIQLVTVSGPEIVDQLPLDDLESAVVQTANAITDAYVSSNDPGLSAIKRQYGMYGGQATTFTTYSGQTGTGGYVVPEYHNYPGLAFMKADGTFLSSLSGWWLVISPDLPQWAFDQFQAMRIKITGTWTAAWYATNHGGSGWDSIFQSLRQGADTGAGYFNASMTPAWYASWIARQFAIDAVVLKNAGGNPQNPPFTAATTVWKKWDYDFIYPPNGMAAGLRAAQSWVPYEGALTVVADSWTGENEVGNVVNVTGALTGMATMKAMTKSVRYDLMSGRKTVTLGAPARVDYGTAMGRVPSSPQDVIVPI